MNTNGGNLGIGNLAPSEKLDVSGSIKATETIWTGYDSGVTNSVSCSNWFRSSGNTGWYNATYNGGIYMTDTTWVRVYANKQFYVSSTAAGAIYTAGGVKADVEMSAPIFYDSANTAYYFDGNSTGDSIRVAGDVVAYYSSDKRLKDNIKPIENALEKVNAINGVTFEWNEKSHKAPGKKDVGVVAQEIEAVFPELVETRANGYKAVDYQKLTAVLIESVKELAAKVEALEAKQCNCK